MMSDKPENCTAAPVAEGVALPPLPEAFGTMENADEEGHTIGWLQGYTADQMRGYAIDHVAPYAERIRQLERELATQLATKSIEALIREVSVELMGEVTERFGLPAEDGDDHGERNYLTGKFAGITMFERELLKRIDARTAGPAVPEGYVIVPLEPTDEMLRLHLAVEWPATYRDYLRHPASGPRTASDTEKEIVKAKKRWAAMIAAAPKPQEDAP